MRYQLLLSIALLPQNVEAFQTSPVARTVPVEYTGRTMRLLMSQEQGSQDPVKKAAKPTKRPKIGIISRLTTSQLSALTELKKDERARVNKQRLLKLGIAASSLLLTMTKSTVARAATPLVVRSGSITPVIYYPGTGIVNMPSPSLYSAVSTSNPGAWFFAVSLFVVTALIRSAKGGHARLLHLMTKYLGALTSTEKDEDVDIGLPVASDWGTYAGSSIDPLKKENMAGVMNDLNKAMEEYRIDARTMLFEPKAAKLEAALEAETENLEQANEYFREQKYKQHHHPIHVKHTRFEEVKYLDTLSVNREEEQHDRPPGYLDTLTTAKTSTWDAYKAQLSQAKPVSYVDELKQEVSELHDLMRDEQSMYQASNQALKLAVDAQNEELHHASSQESLKDFDRRLSTSDELEAFDRKAQEYQDTVVKEVEMSKPSEQKSGPV